MSEDIPASPATLRVVVVGGGFGGFFAPRELCRLLKPAEAYVTLVSDTDAMLYQPLLRDVAVGALDPRRVTVSLRTTLRRARIGAAGIVGRHRPGQRRGRHPNAHHRRALRPSAARPGGRDAHA
jgi:hypothetical protein